MVTAKKATTRSAKKAAAPRRTAKKAAQPKASTEKSTSTNTSSENAPPRKTSRARISVSVATALRKELEAAQMLGSPLAMAALQMAKHVDQADGAQAAAAASRELRLMLATAYSVGKPLSPPEGGNGTEPEDPEGVVVGQDRLEAARRRSEGARQGKKPSR